MRKGPAWIVVLALAVAVVVGAAAVAQSIREHSLAADLDGRLDPRRARRIARPAADGGPVSASLASAIRLVATSARRMRNSVRELRTQRGLSQGQLGSAMGVSRQTINSIEQERYTPSLPLALALARFFQTTVEAMFDAGD